MVQLLYSSASTDYSGDVSLDIVAVVQEPNGSTATSASSTFSFTLNPVSETPDVSSNDVSVVNLRMTVLLMKIQPTRQIYQT